MDQNDFNVERPIGLQLRHNLFGLLVCTGMAHLVLTTFDVPGISYVRVFMVGAIYVCLGVFVRFRHEKWVPVAAAFAGLSLLSGVTEYAITGSHILATTLLLFHLLAIAMSTRYMRLSQDEKTAPKPTG